MKPTPDNTYCSFPFNHVAVDSQGRYKLCCAAEPSNVTVNSMSGEEWFDSNEMNQARQSMLNGTKVSACKTCYLNETKGIKSKRLTERPQLEASENLTEPRLLTVDWRSSNLCNAQCANCSPDDSTSWRQPAKELRAYGINMATHDKQLNLNGDIEAHFDDSTLMNLKEVYFAGGEPSFMPNFTNNLTKLSDDCFIEINTNLFKFSDELFSELKKHPKINIICSMDGTEAGFEVMRHPIPYSTFLGNLNRLIEAGLDSLTLNYTMSFINVSELIPVIEFAQSLAKKLSNFTLDIHTVVNPDFLSPLCLSVEKRKSLMRQVSLHLPFYREFLESIGRYERVLSIVNTLSNELQSPKELVSRSAQYLKWMAEKRPQHRNYLATTGLLKEFNLDNPLIKNETADQAPQSAFAETFCYKKWASPTIYPSQSKMSLCSRTPWRVVPDEDLENMGKDAILNHPYDIARRTDMLSGNLHSDCHHCKNTEKNGAPSERKPIDDEYYSNTWQLNGLHAKLKQRVSSDQSFPQNLSNKKGLATTLDIMVGTQCDLKCVYCVPDVSSQWAKELIRYNELDEKEYKKMQGHRSPLFEETFWNWFKQEGRFSVDRITFQGGEPTFMPDFYKMGERVIENYNAIADQIVENQRSIYLCVITNLNTKEASFNRFLEFLEAGNESITYQVSISIENLFEKAEYVRSNLQWDNFIKNFEKLMAFRNNLKNPHALEIVVHPAFNALSVSQFPDFLKWLAAKSIEHHVPIQIHPNIVQKPNYFNPLILSPDFADYVKESIEFIKNEIETSTHYKTLFTSWKNFRENLLTEMWEGLKFETRNEYIIEGRKKFPAMIKKLDQRRQLDFLRTFPEYKEFLKNCEDNTF